MAAMQGHNCESSMSKFVEKKILPYTPEQMFNLVSDVAAYPQFLPWCVGARVYSQDEDSFDADVIIGFKMFREKFTSRVTLEQNCRVDVDYIKGPIKRLYNHWYFTEAEGGACQIDFEVDFEFKTAILNDLIGGVFEKATRKMMSAFEHRAAKLYGTSK